MYKVLKNLHKQVVHYSLVFLLTLSTMTTASLLITSSKAVAAANTVYSQNFSSDTSGWYDNDDYAGYGDITATGGYGVASGVSGGPFTRFDSYKSVWPGAFTASIDVYLDPAWTNGEGFDYSVAANGVNGSHRRDFILHAGEINGHLLVGATTGSSFSVPAIDAMSPNYEVTSAGWYTIKHSFYNNNGQLAVDISLLNGSSTVFTTTLSDATDLIPSVVGGNRYGWFTFVNVTGGLQIDNATLIVNPMATLTHNGVTTYYGFVQSAIDDAVSGDTVTILAGTVDAFQVVGKSNITITGAGVGSTTVQPTTLISSGVAHKYTANMKASVFVNNSTNVTLKNMTITGNGVTPGSGGPDALVFWNSSTGTITGSAITGNYTINGAQTGQGIALDGLASNLTVSSTNISGFQKNGIDLINGNGATSGGGNVTLTVNGGTITGAGATSTIAQNGIVIWNRGQASNVTATINNTTVQNLSYNDPNTAVATGILAYGPTAAETSTVTVNNVTFTNTQVGFDNETTTPAEVVTPPATPVNTGTPTVNGNTAQTTVSNNVQISNSNGVTATIPAGTTVTASNSSWNGTINAPTVTTVSDVAIPTSSGSTANVALAIEVGVDGVNLTFDKGVRLVLAGQGGKAVGFVRDGVFTAITNTCLDDSQTTGNNLSAGGDCAITVGNDLVVWTKHFTKFVAYTVTTTTAPTTTSTTTTQTTPATTEETPVTEVAVAGSENTYTAPALTETAATVTTARVAWYWWGALIVLILAAAGVGARQYVVSKKTTRGRK